MKQITINSSEDSDQTVRELLEDSDNADKVQFHCGEGFCGACRCKKLSGDVSYDIEPLAWFEKDEILPCIAKMASNKVVIVPH